MKTIIILLAFAASLHAQLIESTLTPDNLATTAAERIVTRINGELERRVAMHRELFTAIWSDPLGAPPETILAKLGAKASLVFALSAENLRHIDACAKLVGKTRQDFLPDSLVTPPRELVHHADGRVTLAP